jgi:hypothetical protein
VSNKIDGNYIKKHCGYYSETGDVSVQLFPLIS